MAGIAGDLIGGRYRLAEQVGRGGMGRVWRGYDQLLEREVAVKEVLLPAGLPEFEREELIARTAQEARAAARLNHPGIVTIHDVVHQSGIPWIVMELVEGQSLGSELAMSGGRLPWERVAVIGAKVADALAKAHATGIVHRDLKPDNILLAGDRVVVTDFGIASIADTTTRLTATGMVLGTPQYMAPEQWDGGTVGPAADMWSLGATLYAAAEGKAPFDGPTLPAIIAAVVGKEPAQARHLGQMAPVLAKLLAKSPDARPSARAAAQALQEATNPHPVTLAVGSLASARAAQSFGGTVPIRRTGQVLDVTEKTFRVEVGERSRTVPVIVELWAKGSDPCTRLSPLLDRLANEAAGAWVLARADVDANPGLAKIFLEPAGASVPVVAAMINGELKDALLGAQVAIPEWYLRQWLTKVVGGLTSAQAASSDLVVDVTEETFMLEVIERSRTVPVIVELWAKQSDPCTRLSPLLDRLANEAAGAWVLARADVDANPGLAKALLEPADLSAPVVYAMINGELKGALQGAQGAITEPYLRQWLPEVLKLTN